MRKEVIGRRKTKKKDRTMKIEGGKKNPGAREKNEEEWTEGKQNMIRVEN